MDSIPATGGSILTKVLGIGSKIAPFAGAAHAWLADPVQNNGFAGAAEFVWDRIQRNPLWHPANGVYHIANPLITTSMALGMPDRYPILPGIASAIMGYIMKAVGKSIDSGVIGTSVNQAGNIMLKYGTSAALNGVAAAWVYLAPFNDSGAGGPAQTSGSGYSRGETKGGPGAVNTYWQVRGGAHIRNATAPVDIYPS